MCTNHVGRSLDLIIEPTEKNCGRDSKENMIKRIIWLLKIATPTDKSTKQFKFSIL